MSSRTNLFFLLFLWIILFQANSCRTSQATLSTSSQEIPPLKLSGGSSGMAMLSDNSYLVVYDVKNYKAGVRLAMIIIKDEAIRVSPVVISGWGK